MIAAVVERSGNIAKRDSLEIALTGVGIKKVHPSSFAKAAEDRKEKRDFGRSGK